MFEVLFSELHSDIFLSGWDWGLARRMRSGIITIKLVIVVAVALVTVGAVKILQGKDPVPFLVLG